VLCNADVSFQQGYETPVEQIAVEQTGVEQTGVEQTGVEQLTSCP
jgi:hypothetical protein